MDRDPEPLPDLPRLPQARATVTLADASLDLHCAYAALDRFATAHALAEETRRDLGLAIDEMISNIAKFAYAKDAAKAVRLELSIDDDAVELVIEDDGVAFDPLSASPPDTGAGLASRKAGGLGIHLVRHLMDAVVYARVGGSNRLTLRKVLSTMGRSAIGTAGR
jgi:serine/threonine-protein kinase RsbW